MSTSGTVLRLTRPILLILDGRTLLCYTLSHNGKQIITNLNNQFGFWRTIGCLMTGRWRKIPSDRMRGRQARSGRGGGLIMWRDGKADRGIPARDYTAL